MRCHNIACGKCQTYPCSCDSKEIERLNMENNKLDSECGHLHADISELKATNAGLLAACELSLDVIETIENFEMDTTNVTNMLKAAIEKAKAEHPY